MRPALGLLARHAMPVLAMVAPAAVLTSLPAALLEARMWDARIEGLAGGSSSSDLVQDWLGWQFGLGLFDLVAVWPLPLAVTFLVLRGRRGEAIVGALRAWPRAVGVMALLLGACVALFIPGVLLVIVGTSSAGGTSASWLVLFGGLLATIAAVVAFFLWFTLLPALPIAVLDAAGPVQALRGAWLRAYGQRSRILTGVVVLGLIGLPPTFGLVILAQFLEPVILRALLTQGIGNLLSTLAFGCVLIVVYEDTQAETHSAPEPDS